MVFCTENEPRFQRQYYCHDIVLYCQLLVSPAFYCLLACLLGEGCLIIRSNKRRMRNREQSVRRAIKIVEFEHSLADLKSDVASCHSPAWCIRL
jgi:hypothetical protein